MTDNPLNVELQDAQGRTNGLKVMVGDVGGVFPGSLTGILVDSVRAGGIIGFPHGEVLTGGRRER